MGARTSKLMGVFLASFMQIALTMTVVAQESISTIGNVGGAGVGPPRMTCLFMTPDDNEVSTDGTQVLPEPAVPNGFSPLFPNVDPNKDGWKRINFYVMASDNAVPFSSSIEGIDISVRYPDGREKFNLTATWSGGSWTASSNGYTQAYYPTVASELPNSPTAAVIPPWSVRELTPAAPGTTDVVDANADGTIGNDSDTRLASFLGAWGSRVAYGDGYNASIASADFNSGKVLALELAGFIWCHQDPVAYSVDAVAYGTGGTAIPAISNEFEFVPTVSLYIDFSTINYGILPSVNISKGIAGDNDLSTPNRPTIWNNGNVDAQATVYATALTLNGDEALAVPGSPNYNPAKIITTFDVTLDYKNDDGTIIQAGTIYFEAGDLPTLVADADGQPVLLKACHPAQIDFSVHSSHPFNVAGSYYGTMTLAIEPYSGGQSPPG